jgi:hypothetical protein
MKYYAAILSGMIALCHVHGFCDNEHETRIQNLESSCPGQINSNGVPHSVHGCMSGFSIEGEFLWWRAHLDSLDYAATVNVPILSPATEAFGYYHEPNFEYDPGVRISLGYDFGRSNWDIFLRWSYHYTDPTGSVSVNPATGSLAPIRDYIIPSGNIAITFADAAHVKWQNRINVIDFEMGYDYFYSKRYSIRPYMGIKAAWIDMEYRTNLTNVTAIAPNPNIGDVLIKTASDYWGGGPGIGMNGYLHIGWGFSLYGTVSGALLYGQYDTSFHQALTSDLIPNITLRLDNYFRQRAMAQIILGCEWAWCFSGNYLLALHIGWEGQYWWNQNQFRYVHDVELSGDLTFSGIDAGIRFDF